MIKKTNTAIILGVRKFAKVLKDRNYRGGISASTKESSDIFIAEIEENRNQLRSTFHCNFLSLFILSPTINQISRFAYHVFHFVIYKLISDFVAELKDLKSQLVTFNHARMISFTFFSVIFLLIIFYHYDLITL